MAADLAATLYSLQIMGQTQDVTLFDEDDGAAAVVPRDSVIPPSGLATGVVVFGGADGGSTERARAVSVDLSGRVKTRLFNRDGSAVETAFGAIKVASEGIFNQGTFLNWIPENFQREIAGATGQLTINNSKARVSPGTAVGYSRVRGRGLGAYIPGAGVTASFSVILADTGSSGNVRRWGLLSDDGNDGFFFQLSGTTLQVVRRQAGVDTAVSAASWNIVSTITADTNGHIWGVRYQWLGVGRIIFYRDGAEVHSIEYQGTAAELSVRDPNLCFWADSTNTSAQGADRYLEIGSVIHACENNFFLSAAVSRYSIASTTTTALVAGTLTSIAALQFRSTKSSVNNRLRARIRRIVVTSNGTGVWRITKNVQITGTLVADNQPNNPDTEYTGMTNAFTTAVNATTASGTGYSASQTVQYKITSVGVVGESLPSTATGSLNVGSPKKQVVLTWLPITYAIAYNIYRQIGGAGSFVYIGTTSEFTFTDDAYAAQAGTPPGANTTEGGSYMQAIMPPTSVVGGRVLSTYVYGANLPEEFLENTDHLYLLPGETISVDFLADKASLATVSIDWEEGPV